MNLVVVHSMVNVTSIALYINDTFNTELLDNAKPLFTTRIFFNLTSSRVSLLNNGKWRVSITSNNDPFTELNGTLAVSTQFVVKPTETTIVPITWKTWVTLALIVVMLVVLATDYFEAWFVIFLTCLILHLFGILSLHELEEAFSQERKLKLLIFSDDYSSFLDYLC